MITGFSTSPSYLNYAGTPKATTAQLITTADAKSVDAAKLPGTSARAQSVIDSLIKTNAGRRESVQGFTSKLQYDQSAVQRLSSAIENLPPQTSQKERDSWNAQLASAKNEVASSQSEIGRFQSALNNDPSTEMALKFAGNLLGMSSDEVHKLYNDRVDALAASKASLRQADLHPLDLPALRPTRRVRAKSGAMTPAEFDLKSRSTASLSAASTTAESPNCMTSMARLANSSALADPAKQVSRGHSSQTTELRSSRTL